jgi:malate dehydrogenase (quinone)
MEDGYDIVLIGAGIMSATLGTMLKELSPALSIAVFERLGEVAEESTDAWNNAGTGHSAFCELNYTPQMPDGSVDISKAIVVAEAFEKSREFWSYLIEKGIIEDPRTFIHPVPHMSFVKGEPAVAFLKIRHAAMSVHPLFQGMQYSQDRAQLETWMPLVMAGRKPVPCAATYMQSGTDVNFGALSRMLFMKLKEKQAAIYLNHDVRELKRDPNGWRLTVKDKTSSSFKSVKGRFVFIGAGGAALPLLIKSGIPEGKGYGGFPVSGQWLICTRREVIDRHSVKVYGKALKGTPPMSVPHLDTRIISGQKHLLFGPYAGLTTKFLKEGSWLDLLRSVRWSNIKPLLAAAAHNIPLTKYLVEQVTQTPEERMLSLSDFVPGAMPGHWYLQDAGQRVQIIKKDKKAGGVIEFGTEVVHAADGSLAALLGASPGASVAVSIMIDLLANCFKKEMASVQWQEKLAAMVPSGPIDKKLNPAYYEASRKRTAGLLRLVNQ